MGNGLRRLMLEDLPKPPLGSHAVAAGDFIFVGGLLPTDFRTGLAEGARSRSDNPLVDDPARAQSEYVTSTAAAILAHCGSSFDSVVRIDQFITERAAAAPYLRARRQAFPLPRRPASSLLAVPGLPLPAARISVDIVAAAPGVVKEGIFTDQASVNFAGAPHGARAGSFVFVQGQIASDFVLPVASAAAPSPFWYETPIERETEYVLAALATILEAADSSLEDIVKAHVYLTDLTEFSEFERVWAKHFAARPPARTIVPVASLGSPACRVEITVVALRRGQPREYINTAKSGREPLAESEAVQAGDFLFLSGLTAGEFRQGLAPEATVSPKAPFFASEIELQSRFALEKAKALCAAAGGSLEQLCWSQLFLEDMRDFYNFARVWGEVIGEAQPAVTTVQVPDLALCPGARVLLDLTAYVPT
jgi:enamine deaminase RidA (YjgF/YER057c/UK114 family)